MTKNPMKPIIANPRNVAHAVFINSARIRARLRRMNKSRRESECGDSGLTLLVWLCALVHQVSRVLCELDKRVPVSEIGSRQR